MQQKLDIQLKMRKHPEQIPHQGSYTGGELFAPPRMLSRKHKTMSNHYLHIKITKIQSTDNTQC